MLSILHRHLLWIALLGVLCALCPAPSFAATVVRLPVTAVTASSHDGNLPANTLDRNLSTRWSAYGDGQWIRYDLGTAKTVTALNIAVYQGNARSTRFEIAVSHDAASWTKVYSGQSSGTSLQAQLVDIPDTTARYVQLVGHGSTVGLWNSLTEVELLGAGASSPTPPPAPTPSPKPSPAPVPPTTACTYYAAPNGSSTASGSLSAPFSLSKGMSTVGAGQTLCVRGGTYSGTLQPSMKAGTATQRVRVQAYPGEQPLVKGLVRLSKLQYVTIDNLDVTWPAAGAGSGDHMVKLTDGVGWEWLNSDISYAASYANVLIYGSPLRWRLAGNTIHDTRKVNSGYQDHNIYAYVKPPTNEADWGVIERNILEGAPGGRNLKIGGSSSASPTSGGIVVRYNTMAEGLGSCNLQFSYSVRHVKAYRNIMQQTNNKHNVCSFNNPAADGSIRIWDNIGYQSHGVIEQHRAITDGGGNLHRDPRLGANWQPQDATARSYGRYAP